MKAQQVLMAHMIETALSKNLLLNGGQIRDFITAGASSLTVSPRLGDPQFVIGLAFSLRKISPDNIVFTTIPFDWTPDGNNVTWNAQGYALLDDIRNDRPIAGNESCVESVGATREGRLVPGRDERMPMSAMRLFPRRHATHGRGHPGLR